MFKRKRSAEDFAEEIKAHLALEADELERDGLSQDVAHTQARREFGNVRVAQERFNMKDRWMPLERLLRDLRFGLRSLVHSPGFALTAILTLALGIGANTAVFSVMNAVLLKSLPVADPDRLVYLHTSNAPMGTGTIDSNQTFSYPVYDALRHQPGALSAIIAFVPLSSSKVAVRYGAQPEEAEGDMVSGSFFSGLGVNLPLGRGFSAQDEANHASIAVLSYNYWTRRFARDPAVLGTSLYVNGVAMTIVGVTVEMRVHGDPLAIVPAARKVLQQLDPNMPIIKPMTQRAQFETTISHQILFTRLAGFFGFLAVVLVATGLYGTLAYRVSMRTGEIGVRMAVGARREQVVWMILKDSLLQTAIGVVLGVPLAILVGRALTSSLYGVNSLDAVSYLLAVAGVAMVALAASAVPANRAATIDPVRALRTE